MCVCGFFASSAVGLADESALFRPSVLSSPWTSFASRVCGAAVCSSLSWCLRWVQLCFLSGPEGPNHPFPPLLRSLPHLCPADPKPRRLLSSSVFGELIQSGDRSGPSAFPLASVMASVTASPMAASPALEVRQKVCQAGIKDRYFSSFTR